MRALYTTSSYPLARIRTYLARFVLPCAVIFFATSTTAGAIQIDGGPVYEPPGAGIPSFTGEATIAGGATVSYTSIDLSQTASLYFGIRSDMFLIGFSMDGGDIAGTEIFRFSQVTANSIVFTGETVFHTEFPEVGAWETATRLTLTFSGAGSIIFDPTTMALNGPLGDVGALWRVESSDFSVHVTIEAIVPPFDANAGNYEPGNDLFNRIGTLFSTASSYDLGFYYEAAVDSDEDGIADFEDNCIEIANADQRDTNDDGFGNRCDPDLDDDCSVSFLDLGLLKSVFFTADADADFDGNGSVSFEDLGVMKAFFFASPGPSGTPNNCEQ